MKDDVTLLVGKAEDTNEDGPVEVAAGPLPRGTSLGRYVVLDEIGAGAMGRVYAGYDPKLDRKVAIKLLRARLDDETLVARLQREAQAMARLTHPNVVAIHDVGDHDGQVFLAMEFVDGATVGQWLHERERSWTEIVEVYRAAGEGLAAAHAAGVVHRDFKPDNVMVAVDGRVLVMDFGLARASNEPRDDPSPSISGDRAAISAELTSAGSLVGTPAYMSPEQFDQAEVGPASDQFSFCAAFYEALFGARPFAGGSLAELAIAVRRGDVEPPARSRVPKWLAATVLRGLSVDPAARHRSMRDLLAALDGGRRRGRTWIWIGAVTLVGLAAGGVALAATSERRKCRAGTEKIAEVWNVERRDRIATAYAELSLPYAPATWAESTPALDAFTERWAQGYYDACAATRIRGEQSGTRLDARMDCLEVQRAHLDSLLSEFEHPDQALVERTLAATNSLPEPEDCGEVEDLPEPEADPELRELAREARSAHAEASARITAGRYDAGVESAERGLELLAGADLPGVEAELLLKLGAARRGAGDFAAAQEATRAGLRAAALARDDRVLAALWIDLLFEVAIEGERAQQGPAIADAAEIALIASGDDPELRWAYEDKRAVVLRKLGDLKQSEVHHRRAIEVAGQHGADMRTISVLRNNFGTTLRELGRYQEARAMHESALAGEIEVYGPEHPVVAQAHNDVARSCSELGDQACALEHYERSLAIRAATLGDDHPEYADSLFNISIFRYERLLVDEAEAGVKRAMEIWPATYGAESDRMAAAYVMLGNIARAREDSEHAAQWHEKAEKVYRKLFGDDSPMVAIALSNRALSLGDLHRFEEALALQEEARRIREAKLGADHPDLAYTFAGIAELLLEMGRPADAIAPAERAIALREAVDPGAHVLASVLFVAARARWDADDDRPRALELARRAYRAYGKANTAVPDSTRIEIEAWLEERGAAPPLEME